MTDPAYRLSGKNSFNCSTFALITKYYLIDYSIKTHNIPNNPIMEGDLKIINKNGFISYIFYQLRKQNRQEGRVSVPATFRSHLNSLGYNGFISYPSFNHAALSLLSRQN